MGSLAVVNANSMDQDKVWAQGDNPDGEKVFREMIVYAITKRASDIHLQWYSDQLAVRLRIDGVLYKCGRSINNAAATKLIAACKLLAEMKMDERRIPQDGRIPVKMKDPDMTKDPADRKEKEYDLRVNCLPSCMGENIVMRILDKGNVPTDLKRLGFTPEIETVFTRIVSQPNGMMIFTGPTGSGKSTTQYAALAHLNVPGIKILTAENPVEYQVEGMTQVQVKGNLTFGMALRAFLRHDPDIIMIGEMRDLETAEVGIEAALTGHMVLSTLHTNSAPAAVTRLVDMGIPAHLIPDTVTGVLAQRLARRICEKCIEPYEAPASAIKHLGYNQPQEKVVLHRGAGCENCRNGYKGRIGIYELMKMSDVLGELVCNGASLVTVRDTAISEGMVTLREDALQKILSGQTTLEEVERVIFTAGS